MPRALTKLAREASEKAYRAFTEQVERFGFVRTGSTTWVRLHEHTADVVHIHRGGISYGAPLNASVSFRVHVAIRVLNSAFDGLALNGPHSDQAYDERLHLRFNAESFHSFDRCVTDLVRYVATTGEAWFLAFRAPNDLLVRDDSPLQDEEKSALRDAVAGNAAEEKVKASRKELGLERKRAVRRHG